MVYVEEEFLHTRMDPERSLDPKVFNNVRHPEDVL